jgi:hypothetical protein
MAKPRRLQSRFGFFKRASPGRPLRREILHLFSVDKISWIGRVLAVEAEGIIKPNGAAILRGDTKY